MNRTKQAAQQSGRRNKPQRSGEKMFTVMIKGKTERLPGSIIKKIAEDRQRYHGTAPNGQEVHSLTISRFGGKVFIEDASGDMKDYKPEDLAVALPGIKAALDKHFAATSVS